MALWIYISISIDKLPAWTNFWQSSLPKELNALHLTTLFQDSLTEFDTEVNNIGETAANRLIECGASLSLAAALGERPRQHIDTVSRDIPETMESDNIAKAVREIAHMATFYPKQLSDLGMRCEGVLSGGVITAKTEKQQRIAALRVFGFTAFYAFRHVEHSTVLITRTLLSLLLMVRTRYRDIGEYQTSRTAGSEELLTNDTSQIGAALNTKDDLIPLILDVIAKCPTTSDNIQLDGTAKERLLELRISKPRSGKRWMELKSTLGEGILLAGSPLAWGALPISRSPFLQFDILPAVEHGTDDEFSQLKDLLLSTKFSWLKTMCSRFGGLVLRFKTLDPNLGLAEWQALQGEVSETVERAFGGLSLLREAAAESSAKRGHAGQALPMLLDYLPQPEELSEQARRMRDMLVTSIRDAILQLGEEDEMGDWDAELGLMKEALDKASDKFLEAYRSSLNEGKVSEECAVNITRVRLRRATDMFCEIVLDIWKSAFLSSSAEKEGGFCAQAERIKSDLVPAFTKIFF